MLTHDSAAPGRRVRRVTSTFAVTAGLTAVLVLAGGVLDVAGADTPQGWEEAPAVSGFDYVLVLVLLPLGLAAIISFLAFLPTLTHDHGYQPGQAWRGESTWIGGPRKGVEAADDVSPEQVRSSESGTGGTSGRW